MHQSRGSALTHELKTPALAGPFPCESANEFGVNAPAGIKKRAMCGSGHGQAYFHPRGQEFEPTSRHRAAFPHIIAFYGRSGERVGVRLCLFPETHLF